MKQLTFSYALVESVLAQLLDIVPSKRGAFEARLRHLRQLGIPRSKKPGSGKRISYERSDAAEMMVALLLQSIGCAPKLSVRAARFAVMANVTSRNQEGWFVLLPDEKFDLVRADRIGDLVAIEKVSSLLNLSRAFAELDARLISERVRI